MAQNKRQKDMLEYLVAKLEPNYKNVVAHTESFNAGTNTTYIQVDNGLVMLVDKVYGTRNGEDTFRNAYIKLMNYSKAKFGNANVATVFLKDGENYFRSRAKEVFNKRDLSHKNMTPEQMRNTIILRPEERYAFDMKDAWIQYYQPKSDKLEEEIVSYKFSKIKPDYSHIDPYNTNLAFVPPELPHKRKHVWTQKRENPHDLYVNMGYLSSVKPKELS